MQFKVPQFLEIEDKIFGPFTFRQFVYMAGGVGICFILYKLLGIWLSALPIIAIGIFSWMLAFYRPNDKPFINMVESSFKYAFQDKLYIWQRRRAEPSKKSAEPAQNNSKVAYSGAKLTGSKLRDLAWSLDVLDIKKQEK